ncbi:CHAD domain-containing protein [Martelella radicis]|uniref:CHAD domain-containing protein n=1 Tax=Martelella radicis TaxID=1397476 RepID=A0A7W6KMV4_9HYPH|nr:CHAD domain-containing protein [Martelella radicis]MBB4122765.1 CHAD domain-containing protein [Martelella radicis]
MAFSLDPDKPFDAAFRKVAVSQLEDAIKALRKQPRGLDEAVHDARKKFKRVRGLLRLIRPAAKDFSRAENARIRDMAADLSGGRDATALIECAAYLRGLADDGGRDMALSRLETTLRERRDSAAVSDAALRKKAKEAIHTCRDAIAAIEEAAFHADRSAAAKCIGKAWKKQLANAQVALMTVQADGADGDFHELRKKSQTYWMFCALLSPAWPSALKAKRNDAKALADLLGHEHDLSMLLQLLDSPDAPGLDSETLATCRDAALETRAQLRRRAIKSARKTFGDEPDVEARIIRTLWKKRAHAHHGE